MKLKQQSQQLNNHSAERKRHLLSVVVALAMVSIIGITFSKSVFAQFDNVGTLFPDSVSLENSQMLIQADELEFDNDQNTISAIGNVKVNLDDYKLTADLIRLERKTSRLVAEGNIELTNPDGTVITADSLNMSEDFRDGFVYSLSVLSLQRTRIQAEKVEKIDENVMRFESATYSPYYSSPMKYPPLWRLKAVRIVQDNNIELIVLDDMRLELFGIPVAYLPKFVVSDPKARKGTGLLNPTYHYNQFQGYGFVAPYYVSLAPNYDTTLTTAFMTKQGLLFDLEWRHLINNINYSVGFAGIGQQDSDAFTEDLDPEKYRTNSADRTFRGGFRTDGEMKLSPLWNMGWNYSILTDRRFPHDYATANVGHYGHDPRIYLRGNHNRNNFHAAIYKLRVADDPYYCLIKHDCHYRLSPNSANREIEIDPQDFQPLIRPAIEHEYYFDKPAFGGEVSVFTNFASLSRKMTEVNAYKEDEYYYPGYAGNHTRISTRGNWQHRIVDSAGQIFTPFAYVQLDIFQNTELETDELVHLTKDQMNFRIMPAVGMLYDYPFVSSYDWGAQIVNPVGQLIVRPSETGIGKYPNNDSHSVVFETANLFESDKFTGYDRSEGGTRLNLGIRHVVQFGSSSTLSSLLGQSINIAGINSYEESDLTHPFVGASLDSPFSDYITSHFLDTSIGLQLGVSNWIDKDDFELNRTDLTSAGYFGPMVGSAKYSFLRTNTESKDELLQEGQVSTGLKVHDNWRIYGSLRYDIEENVNTFSSLGMGYDDEGISISATFGEENDRSGELINRYIRFNISPRTLGEIDLDQIQSLGFLDYNFFN